MNAGEAASRTLFGSQPLLDLCQNDVPIELSGPVLREAGDAGLRGVPVALVLHVDMVGLLGEAAQRVPEDGDTLPRLDAAELDTLLFDASVSGVEGGSRAHV